MAAAVADGQAGRAGRPQAPGPRISLAGAGGLLFDPAGPGFSGPLQDRIHALARAALAAGATEAVPGMNNLLVLFDPLALTAATMAARLRDGWGATASAPLPLPGPSSDTLPADTPAAAPAAREVVLPVRYGGAEGPDLAAVAAAAGLAPEAYARAHAAGRYRVAALGFLPGFPYLSGLDPRLAVPRRADPHPGLPAGAVIVGGAQTAVLPVAAPSGWHMIGRTDARLFDPGRDEPALLRPGDILRFVPPEPGR